MPHVALYLLGAPRLERAGVVLEVNTRKAIALLAYLTLTGQPHRRETLAALLWPDYEPGRARAALRSTLWALNKALDGAWLVVERDEVGLADGSDFWVDAGRFQQLLTSAGVDQPARPDDCAAVLETLSEAVALYQGDFMAGFSLRDSPAFDEWQFFQTEQFRQAFVAGLDRLVCCYTQLQAYEAAIPYAQRWVAIDPLHEPAQRSLMQLYFHNGQRSAALRQYQQCVRILEEELGASPQPETTALYELIRQTSARSSRSNQLEPGSVEIPPLEAEITEPVAASAQLPAPLTPFIGREAELAEINRRLAEPACRLLTLVGPGGIGKTRLAIQVAYDQADRFPAGVHFVSLAGVETPGILLSTTIKTLRLPLESGSQLKTQLLSYLQGKQLLLIMDNFEQLLNGAELLTEMLATVTNVKIMVTSRERLNVQGEWIFVVPGMQVPVGRSAFNGIEGYSAVQLFLQSANRTRADFALQSQDKPVVARICELVDGVPLGIELAAAWVRVLSLAEIATEIERSLDFLTSARRDVPERHRSLRAAFEHSWSLLSDREREVYRKLAVFQGGFDRAAGAAVAGADLMTLSNLVDKSLIYRNGSGRYELHQILRQYAQEKLSTLTIEQAETERRHCHYFAALVDRLRQANEDCELRFETLHDPIVRRAAVLEEIDNIRAAWRYAVTQLQLPQIAQFIADLPAFFESQVWLQEGHAALDMAIEHLRVALRQPGLAEPTRCSLEEVLLAVLSRQSKFCSSLGLHERAEAVAEEALTIADQHQNLEKIALGRFALAKLAMNQGRYDQAREQYQQALTIYRQLDQPKSVLKILSSLAYLAADAGNYDEAEKWIEESLYHNRQYHSLTADLQTEARPGTRLTVTFDPVRPSSNLPTCALGYTYFLIGKYHEAKRLLEDALVEARASNHQMYLLVALINIGYTSEVLDEDEAAEAYFDEALAIARQAQSVPLALDILAGIGMMLVKGAGRTQGFDMLRLVFDHPVSLQESKNRATERLAKLSLSLPTDRPPLWQANRPDSLWQIVAAWLDERQVVTSDLAG